LLSFATKCSLVFPSFLCFLLGVRCRRVRARKRPQRRRGRGAAADAGGRLRNRAIVRRSRRSREIIGHLAGATSTLARGTFAPACSGSLQPARRRRRRRRVGHARAFFGRYNHACPAFVNHSCLSYQTLILYSFLY
jgi:hypothetical protein